MMHDENPTEMKNDRNAIKVDQCIIPEFDSYGFKFHLILRLSVLKTGY
jgi:hypothetical protein